ncbi:cytochrome b [Tabrizicola soli]|uniref:Cytochrome b n=1 Tax=Tabrizicola soli TaxID=2185115 RepID=A0ABV7DT16_9RHOB|nr:cytochrome b/b6 domain-containing protein [Tabrizicola soli]
MGLKNGPEEFGLVTRLLHWTMMLLILGQLALGLRLANLEPGLANLWLYGLHKTLGFLALALILLRIAWHIASPPPLPLGPRNALFWTARAVHRAIYLLLVALPLTGWAGSSATGIDVMIADRWIVPPLVEASEQAETFWFGLHDILTKLLMALIAVHILGALKRQAEGDGTLTRMLKGRV